MKLKTILVPLDGSVLAEAALMPAANLARENGAKLVLLRAAATHRLPMLDPVHAQVEVMREAQEYLGAVRARRVLPHERPGRLHQLSHHARAVRRQFYLDFVEAENSTGFHAPQEAARIFAESIDFTRQGQLALRDLTPARSR